jgi:1,2-dihydroxy-3-keto-5-methylthiopentene dioxygenase
MAILQREDGTVYLDLDEIARELAPLGIQLNRWQIGDRPSLRALLQAPALTDAEKEQVLTEFDHYFATLKETAGYQTRDLIAIHPDTPNLDAMLSKFDKIHTHADDEVRYVIDGEGVFGFVYPDGSQVRLTVQPEEYINVPAGTEHWFYLTSIKRIKAIRYFTSPEGWVAQYTNRDIRLPVTAG